MKVWPYNPYRAHEFKSSACVATNKQIAYIRYLSDRRDDDNKELASILNAIPDSQGVESLTKGQAMFVIKCLKGELKQVEITPDILKRIDQVRSEKDASSS